MLVAFLIVENVAMNPYFKNTFAALLVVFIAACQTTIEDSSNAVFLKLESRLSYPQYEGEIRPITDPVKINYVAFGEGYISVNKEVTIRDDLSSNGVPEQLPETRLKVESRSHQDGTLLRLSVPLDEDGEEIELGIVRTPSGKVKNLDVSSNRKRSPNDLRYMGKLFSAAFDLRYRNPVEQGNELFPFTQQKRLLESFAEGMGGKADVLSANTTVIGKTNYKGRSAILSTLAFRMRMSAGDLGINMAAFGYYLVDTESGFVIREETDSIIHMIEGGKDGYIQTLETKEFVSEY